MNTTEDITSSNNFTAGYECAVDLKLAYTYILYIDVVESKIQDKFLRIRYTYTILI